MKAMDSKFVRMKQFQISSQSGNGIGRLTDSQTDRFVLTRKINYPELIWNQNPHYDRQHKKRYFEVDAAEQWKLSQKDECFICDAQCYTVIFFKDGGPIGTNKDLFEITDPKLLLKIK